MSSSIPELLRGVRRGILQSQESTTHAQKTIDYSHAEVHGGRAFVFTDISELDTNETREIRILTPDSSRWSHVIVSVVTGLAAQADLIEDTTLSHVAGNALDTVNRDRNSVNVSGMTVCHTPGQNSSSSSSGVGVDTVLAHQAWGTPGKGTSPGFGGTARGSAEWILKPDTAYLLRVTSGADANVVSIEGDWYEHVNK